MTASPSIPRPHRLLSVALAAAFGLAAAGCSGTDEATSPTTSTAAGETTAPAGGTGEGSTTAPTTTTAPAPTTTFVVPEIDAAQIPEICAGAQEVAAADEAITSLLGPALQAEDGPAADSALLAAIAQAQPAIDQARVGYDRMAAALPPGLAADADAVRDATVTIYGQVTGARSVDELVEVVNVGRDMAKLAAEAGYRLNETTKAVCDGLELSN